MPSSLIMTGWKDFILWNRKLLVLLVVLYSLAIGGLCAYTPPDGPRYFHTPMLEIMDKDVYLTQTDHQETIISFAGKGADLHVGDYLTHADGVRILNGGLKAFLKNGDGEAIVPIIDEEDIKHGGNRLIGFVLVQVVNPRKLSTRRGEVVLDFEEGGPAPTMNLGNHDNLMFESVSYISSQVIW